jgi:hypothetical protein
MAYTRVRKMSKPIHILTDIIDFILKNIITVSIIGMTIIGRIGYYMMGSKRETGWQLFGRVLVSVAVGTLSSIYFMIKYPAGVDGISLQAALGISLVTLISDKIIKFFVTMNMKDWIAVIKGIDYNGVMKIIFKKKGRE